MNRTIIKRTVIIIAAIAVLLATGATWLNAAAPAIGSLNADPAYIVINTLTDVTFTTHIDSDGIIPGSLNLFKTDGNGNVLGQVVTLHDDGQNGDAVAGDHTYSARLTINEATVGQEHYRVSAAFRGTLRRGVSTPSTVYVDPFKLPPDPGEAGKQTLEGIDSDNDGVRDDVQRYIAIAYQNSAKTRAALSQYAASLQQALTVASDPTAAGGAWTQIANDLSCLADILGSTQANQDRVIVRAQFLNTVERSRAYLRAGQYAPPPTVDLNQTSSPAYRSCKFNPQQLPN
jgi:hypothetical protein